MDVTPAADALDGRALRDAFACFPSGVTAVCALVEDGPVGMAASSFTSVSLDPPLVSVCVADTSSTWVRLRGAPRLGVSVLGADQAPVCRRLAARGVDRFAGTSWRATPDGAVLLDGVPVSFECSLEGELAAGDHQIALLRIHAIDADPSVAPLVFHASTYHRLTPHLAQLPDSAT